MIRTSHFSAILASAVILSGAVFAQESDETKQQTNKTNDLKQLVLDADGNLKGKVVAKIGDDEKPVEAKMTLIRGGVKVKTIFADEQGNFSFGNVPPGKYSVSGSAARFAAVEPVAVVRASPNAAPTPIAQDNNIVLCAPTYSSYSPAASYGYPASNGGGFVSGGRGRLLGGRRLLRLGLVGGIVAIAVSGDNDASPDN